MSESLGTLLERSTLSRGARTERDESEIEKSLTRLVSTLLANVYTIPTFACFFNFIYLLHV